MGGLHPAASGRFANLPFVGTRGKTHCHHVKGDTQPLEDLTNTVTFTFRKEMRCRGFRELRGAL